MLENSPVVTQETTTGAELPCLIGLRDRALIRLMVYSFARIGAVLGMQVFDYYPSGKRWWIKLHEVFAHHSLVDYLDEYIKAAGIVEGKKGSLFRTTEL